MAHFAKVVKDIVIEVIVAEPDFFDGYVDDSPGEWIQCSYNTRYNKHLLGGTPLRGNFPGPGYIYDRDLDVFIEPKPFNSWLFDKENCKWIPPIPMPESTAEVKYVWNEEEQNWIKINKNQSL